MRGLIQPQLKNALQLLETDLRGLWPQLQDTMESKFAAESKAHLNQTIPDFARQRRELLQSVQLALVERVGGKEMEEQLEQMFRETGSWLRLPFDLAAAGGIVTVIAAMSSAAVADVTGIVAASAAVIGTFIDLDDGGRFWPNIIGKWNQNALSSRMWSINISNMRSIFLQRDQRCFPTVGSLLRIRAQTL